MQQPNLDFSHVGLDFLDINLDLEHADLDLEHVGLDFFYIGLDLKHADLDFFHADFFNKSIALCFVLKKFCRFVLLRQSLNTNLVSNSIKTIHAQCSFKN